MGEYVEIPLSGKRGKGLVALVDAADAPLVQGKKWNLYERRRKYTVQRYVITGVRINGKSVGTASMHRTILGLGAGDKRQVDHQDHDGLNNRRSNLRIASQRDNSRNVRKHHGASRFKGVSRNPAQWLGETIKPLGIGLPTDRVAKHTNLPHVPTWELRRPRIQELIDRHCSLQAMGDEFGVTRERMRQVIVGLGLRRVKIHKGRCVDAPWQANIKLQQGCRFLGVFPTEEEAAMRYNVAARKFFGEFACLNQVDMG